MMKALLIVFCLLMAVVVQAAILSASEQYRRLQAEKQREDAETEKTFAAQRDAIEADCDLAIYKGFLKLHAEHDLDARLLRFTGNVTQRVSVMFGKKQLVVRVTGTSDVVDVTANFKEKIPDSIKVGDCVTVSGMFDKGNLAGVTLSNASAILKNSK